MIIIIIIIIRLCFIVNGTITEKSIYFLLITGKGKSYSIEFIGLD